MWDERLRQMYVRSAPGYQKRQRWVADHPVLGALLIGSVFGLGMGLWFGLRSGIAFGAATALACGLFFGCLMALAIRRAVRLGEASL